MTTEQDARIHASMEKVRRALQGPARLHEWHDYERQENVEQMLESLAWARGELYQWQKMGQGELASMMRLAFGQRIERITEKLKMQGAWE